MREKPLNLEGPAVRTALSIAMLLLVAASGCSKAQVDRPEAGAPPNSAGPVRESEGFADRDALARAWIELLNHPGTATFDALVPGSLLRAQILSCPDPDGGVAAELREGREKLPAAVAAHLGGATVAFVSVE